jgi:type II secretory pathway pseudopilin PulG
MRKKFKIRGGANSFTLLEMLGVLAVMAILASVAVPPMLRSLQNAQSVNEDKNLEEIGRALCEAIKAEGRVPNPTVAANAVGGWVAMAAPYCSMASDAIQYVYSGRAETERRFYILTIDGATQTLLSPSSYAVPSTGWIDLSAVGVQYWKGIKTSFLVLISSSKPDYLLACPANGSATYSAWAGLAGPVAVRSAKDWVKQAVNGVYSANIPDIVGTVQNASGTWTNKGQFLHVKVIPMNSLICNISFVLPPPFVGGAGTRIRDFLTLEPFASCYVIKGSTVYATDATGISVTATATSSLLTLDFSTGAWIVDH